MKVRIVVTLDIDPEAWEMNYGARGAAMIRDDVLSWAQNLLTEAARESGNLLEGAANRRPAETFSS